MVNERGRNWELGKQASSRCYSRTYKEIKKAKKQMQGLSAQEIQKILNCCKSFLGCYASDQLENLSLSFFPCTFIVNTDKNGMSGTHWICFRISKRRVEMFDSLGLVYENKLSKEIPTFMQRFAVSRDIKFNRCLQLNSSNWCGFYWKFLYFWVSFVHLVDVNKNDNTVTKFFK